MPRPLARPSETPAPPVDGGWQAGEADDLARAVYDELRALAASHLRYERPDHSLQPTELVHEAYLRLMGPSRPAWRDRSHFFKVAARVMRHLLVDHARQARTAKRGPTVVRVPLDALDADVVPGTSDAEAVLEVERVHDALGALAALDARQARLVELRFFVGLTIEEAADVLGVSRATAVREWGLARAWLAAELHGG